MANLDRIAAALVAVRARLENKDSTILELRGQLEAKIKELASISAVAARFEALASMTYWAELESGKNIKAGETVRYLGKTYKCIQTHAKSLLRLPTNAEYWEVINQ